MPTQNPQEIPSTGRVICFDVGKKTLGIAISDASRTIASPQPTLTRGKWSNDKQIIAKTIAEQQISCAVVGLPLALSGEQTPSTTMATTFADMLEKDLNIPVLMWDERLSTAAAEAAMFEQRTGRQTRASKRDIKQQGLDSVAASLILQSVLPAISR